MGKFVYSWSNMGTTEQTKINYFCVINFNFVKFVLDILQIYFVDNELTLVYVADPVFKLIDTTSQICIIMLKVVGLEQ